MERVTISLEDSLLEAFDAFIKRRGYENRSEAVRDLLRQSLHQESISEDGSPSVVACLSYVYNHHSRDLAQRLTKAQHQHHSMIQSTLHVHLDQKHCLEVVLLEGLAPEVRRFAERAIAETGVCHGQLNMIPAVFLAEGEGYSNHNLPISRT